MLLKESADAARIDGLEVTLDPADGREHRFPYTVVRVWEIPVERLLTGGLATLPLAPVSAVMPAEVPAVLTRMRERVEAELPRQEQREFWARVNIVLGLRYSREETEAWHQGARHIMRESVTYQAILEEGEARGRLTTLWTILLELGTERFGPPDEAVLTTVRNADLTHADRMRRRLLSAPSWADLVAEPG